MKCIVWAPLKARVDRDEEEISDVDDDEPERDTPNDEGTLLETEKDVLRTVQLTDLLADSSENPAEGENIVRDNHDDEDDDDETTAALKTSLVETSSGSLRYHHNTFLLETRTQQNEVQARREKMRRERYQQRLLSRGVSAENVMLLLRDVNELKNTEKELHECMVTLEASLDPEMKASMNALREILEEKLKDHHMHLGTQLDVKILARRKKVCMELGLLKKEDQDMVKSLSEPLPLPNSKQSVETDEELFEGNPKHQLTWRKTTWISLAHSRRARSRMVKHLTMRAQMKKACS